MSPSSLKLNSLSVGRFFAEAHGCKLEAWRGVHARDLAGARWVQGVVRLLDAARREVNSC